MTAQSLSYNVTKYFPKSVLKTKCGSIRHGWSLLIFHELFSVKKNSRIYLPLCITCFNAFTCLDLLDDILILLLSRVTTEKLSGLWRLIWKEQKHVEWQLTVVNCWCQKTYSNQILSFQIKFLIWITLEGNNAVSITQQFIMYHSKYQPII